MNGAPIQSMTSMAIPLYSMAYMLGHKDEIVQSLGVTFLLTAAQSCIEYVEYLTHAQTCPRCILKQKLIDIYAKSEVAK